MHNTASAMASETNAASITKTGNQQHAWMTLRVPTTGAGHLGNVHQQPQQPPVSNPVGFRPQQPHLQQPLNGGGQMMVHTFSYY